MTGDFHHGILDRIRDRRGEDCEQLLVEAAACIVELQAMVKVARPYIESYFRRED